MITFTALTGLSLASAQGHNHIRLGLPGKAAIHLQIWERRGKGDLSDRDWASLIDVVCVSSLSHVLNAALNKVNAVPIGCCIALTLGRNHQRVVTKVHTWAFMSTAECVCHWQHGECSRIYATCLYERCQGAAHSPYLSRLYQIWCASATTDIFEA